MDPKALANLDPKLRETYERVMGTASATPSSMPPPASPPSVGPVLFDNPSSTPPITQPVTPNQNGNISEMPSAKDAQAIIPTVGQVNTAEMTSSAPPTVPPVAEQTTPPASPQPFMGGGAVSAEQTQSSIDQPIQPAELASLQPSMTGAPMPESKEALQLSKPLQPLPSPASVNHQPAPEAAAQPSSVIKTLYFVAAIIFFIVYAIFWLKVFQYPLPF